jgi:hypothetical protein
MTQQIEYEWLYETIDAHGSIVDVDHTDELCQLPEVGVDVGVVCYIDNTPSWAYIQNGALPAMFRDAYDRETIEVPQRFHDELNAYQNLNLPKPEFYWSVGLGKAVNSKGEE